MADWAPEHFVPVAGFLILALALLLFYFSAMRPRRGTTEWMGRIDRPRFTALRCGRLRLGGRFYINILLRFSPHRWCLHSKLSGLILCACNTRTAHLAKNCIHWHCRTALQAFVHRRAALFTKRRFSVQKRAAYDAFHIVPPKYV